MSYHITLGSGRCQHTIRQGQLNTQNNVDTVLCDSVLAQGQEPVTEVQKMCFNLRNGNYEGVQGVPANFTCTVPVTSDALLDATLCQATTGFREDFGQR